jgi:hypothetical protein
VNPEIAARLEALHIQSFATEKGYTLFTRENCAAIGHGVSLGSSGIMTDAGLAYLTWREGQPYLTTHGGSAVPASAEQVDTLRRFSDDLKSAVGQSPDLPATGK